MKGKLFLAGIMLLFSVFLAAGRDRSPLYVNLRDFPVYIKTGFDPAYTRTVPQEGEGWKLIKTDPAKPTPIVVKDLDLPGMPKRVFLSPFGAEEREFTFVIPFTMPDMTALENDPPIPGINLAGLGDNWEIYLNGVIVKGEMHLDRDGHITSHRNYRNIYFLLERDLFKQGENILVFRIVGDPTFNDVGFFYASPYEIDSYSDIIRQNNETITLVLIGIYLFMGFYHLFMYLLRRKDTHNLFYGLFSIMLGISYLVRDNAAYTFFPDRGILLRVEFFSAYLLIPLGAMFLEHLCLKKTALVTKIYSAFFTLLAVAQLFFSLPFAIDTLLIWSNVVIFVAPFILVYDVGYLFFRSVKELRVQYINQGRQLSTPMLLLKTMAETPMGNLLVGALICLGTGVFDSLDTLVFHSGLALTRYGFFIFTVGAAFVLARRFAAMYNQQQRIIIRSNKGMNAKLVDWIVVQDRDPYELPSVNANSAIMFTDVRNFTTLSEGMSSQALTDFLGALNEVLAKPLFDHEDQGCVAYTDKFMGDGTMNIFTDPAIALKVAVDLRTQLEVFNRDPRSYFKEAQKDLRVNVGTGIAYGPVTLGIMGHSRRVDYTPIGDTVNLASRLEGLTKEYHVSILINDALYGALNSREASPGSPVDFNLRHIDRIRVKGKEQPVSIYEEFSSDLPFLKELKLKMLGELKELQEMYFSGKNWEDAIKLGEELSDNLEKTLAERGIAGPGDYLPAVYVDRMKTLLGSSELLARWDGVYTFNRK